MSDSGIGFGGFLLGLGVGWYLFQYIDLGFEIFSYLLILVGVAMILGGLLQRGGRPNPISGMFGGLIGGLFLAAFLTQGFGFVFNFADEFSNIGDYRATETFTEEFPVTVDMMEIDINSVNGGIDVASWSGDSVKFDIEVKARGGTTAEAEDNVADFEVDLNSVVVGGVQDITLSFPIPSTEWSKYSVQIDVLVPSDTTAYYDLRTTNGGVTLDDITGKSIIISTTNGAIDLSDAIATTLDVETTNGAITGTITTPESIISTTNGGIDLTLTKTSGTHVLETTNGAIDLSLPTGSDVGYKVNLDTSIGSIDVNLPNMDYSIDRTRTKIGETSEYSGKQVQIEITADTTIGSIELN